jgi:hypothetical protein
MKHGRSAYNRGCRCEVCKAATAEYRRAWRARLREGGTPPPKHGVTGYALYGCRCEVCRDAAATAQRQQLEARTARLDEAPHGTTTGYNSWGCRCGECRKAIRGRKGPGVPGFLQARTKHNAGVQASTLEQARNRYKQWTGPELEIAGRADLSHQDVALMLGRTYSAVRNIRQKMEYDPRKQNLAGLPKDGLDVS